MTTAADDLFAGAGGWDLAAAALGIEARGVENMKEARATRDAAGLITQHDDVWTFEPDGEAELQIASPPCQTFSTAGKGAGRKALDDVLTAIRRRAWRSLDHLRAVGEEVGDERTALVLTPLHFAMMHPQYRTLAWEQVPTVLPVWEACAATLRAYGWSVWTGKLHAEQYGVPQTRTRAFLLASRDHVVAPPAPTHSRYYTRDPKRLDPGVLPWVSMAEALGWGMTQRPSPTVTGGGVETGGAEPIAKWARYTGRPDFVPALFSHMSGAGKASTVQRPRSVEEPSRTITGVGSAEWHNRPTPALFRASNAAHAAIRPIDAPAPTVMFGHACNDVRWYPEGGTTRGVAETAEGRHPESRRVSIAEAAVLQSFPADHPWQGTKSRQYLQAGNAVPPLLAMRAIEAAVGTGRIEVAA